MEVMKSNFDGRIPPGLLETSYTCNKLVRDVSKEL